MRWKSETPTFCSVRRTLMENTQLSHGTRTKTCSLARPIWEPLKKSSSLCGFPLFSRRLASFWCCPPLCDASLWLTGNSRRPTKVRRVTHKTKQKTGRRPWRTWEEEEIQNWASSALSKHLNEPWTSTGRPSWRCWGYLQLCWSSFSSSPFLTLFPRWTLLQIKEQMSTAAVYLRLQISQVQLAWKILLQPVATVCAILVCWEWPQIPRYLALVTTWARASSHWYLHCSSASIPSIHWSGKRPLELVTARLEAEPGPRLVCSLPQLVNVPKPERMSF